MSRTYFAIKNKQPKQHMSDLRYYFYSAHKPPMDSYNGTLINIEDEELEDNYNIKRRFRDMAGSMRSR